MRLQKITPKIYRILGLEFFVFATFIGICAIIDLLIVGIDINPNPTVNFIIGASKVLISVILIAIWLYIWYYITKRLMLSKEEIAESKRERRVKKQKKLQQKKDNNGKKREDIKI
ncbi:MAG: hypothetical protein KGD64_03120 [Candidatus Heimdallarchaeota archaeon]|nr:hypothetical protein [Candidatus Heimdallarchaeota archaeon]